MTRKPVDPACQLHGYHSPVPLWIEKHHIVPVGMGGPDEPANWLWCCPTGHFNIHALLGPLANKKVVPRRGTRTEREYAQLGYDRWVELGKPGNPHAGYGLTNI